METGGSRRAMSRRTALTATAAAICGIPALAAEQAGGRIRICQSIALNGPLGDLGRTIHDGSRAYFDFLNARGGVNGRRIDLLALDDGYDVKRAMANFKSFMDDPATFALFGCFGTPMIEAMLPQVLESRVPFFAPLTGALSARPKARNVFNVRVSYPDEAEQLIRHISTISMKNVGVIYQNNAFGKEVFAGAQAAVGKYQLQAAGSATVENDASDAKSAAARVAAAKPDAVLLGLAGKPFVETVQAIRAIRPGISLYALSIVGTAAALSALGEQVRGVTISQVVPSPVKMTLPVVRDFLAAWKAAGIDKTPSHPALEGYLNARVFAECLKAAGKSPTRESFVASAWGLKRDLGGFDVHFVEPGRNASRFVELSMFRPGGSLVR